MSTNDITRYLNPPRRHYAGARMQQGRVILDADFNEEAQLDDEDQRRALADIIGSKGSPDAGFSIALASGDSLPLTPMMVGGQVVDVLDFAIAAGTFYLGGLRFDLEGLEPVHLQRDYLQMPASEAAQPSSSAVSVFTYLCAEERCVSGIEDEELIEKALAGPDTSVRMRRMRQVRIRTFTDELECPAAFDAVVSDLEDNAVFNRDTCELESEGRLRIELEGDASDDACAPCDPTTDGRYLGAENQAVRVMLTSEETFVWAFDNGAPLYRIEVSAGTITMLTPPKDVEHWPVENTVIELIPWGAVLDNGEKVADAIGIFARVTAFEPGDAPSLEIAPADMSAFLALVHQWDAAHPANDDNPGALDTGRARGGYMRIWHRADLAGEQVEINVSPAAALAGTGLIPHFEQQGRRGDYWIIAARPTDPERLVPWDLLTAPDGVRPHGPRKFYAPLGLFRWSADSVQSVHDCRRRFRPLTEQQRCCTYTVGDGITSFGDYISIQDAVDALPATGGTVCVLPGRYAGPIVVTKSHVTIHGCGRESIVHSAPDVDRQAVFLIQATAGVFLRDLAIEAAGEPGVLVERAGGVDATDTRLERLMIASEGFGDVQTRSAIEARETVDLVVQACEISMAGSVSVHAAVFVHGEGLVVRDCHVETQTDQRVPEALVIEKQVDRASFAWGGIQIGGGSQRVVVERNRVFGGLGHGITLGSLEWRSVSNPLIILWLGAGIGLVNLLDPCPDVQWYPGGPVVIGGTEYYPVSAGDLEDVQVADNRVERMATNGISVLSTIVPVTPGGFFQDQTFDVISITGLRVTGNVVTRNLRRPADEVPLIRPDGDSTALPDDPDHAISGLVHGGIVLSELRAGTIEHNAVIHNGTTHVAPTTGIFVLLADEVAIRDNRIRGNGERRGSTSAVRAGTRGGIVVWFGGIDYSTGRRSFLSGVGPRVRVQGNMVQQPEGRSLTLRAMGPVAIEGNHLASQGNSSGQKAFTSALGLRVANYGVPWELVGIDNMAGGGATMFNDNQVIFDWRTKSPSSLGWTAASIFSSDDVTMTGNQMMLTTGSGSSFLKGVHTHVEVRGSNVLVGNNRFAERARGVRFSLHSQAGHMNTTANNNATHCILATSDAGLLNNKPNLVIDDSNCARNGKLVTEVFLGKASELLLVKDFSG
jgi:Family of unknown function (DUF6519)